MNKTNTLTEPSRTPIFFSSIKQRKNPTKETKTNKKELTDQMKKEVVTDKPGSVRAPMPVIDSDKCGVAASLDLAVILNNLIGLNNGERDLATGVLLEVSAPEKRVVLTTAIIILAHTGISSNRSPTR